MLSSKNPNENDSSDESDSNFKGNEQKKADFIGVLNEVKTKKGKGKFIITIINYLLVKSKSKNKSYLKF